MKLCDQCGAEFTPRRPWGRFCGTACSNKWHNVNRRPIRKKPVKREPPRKRYRLNCSAETHELVRKGAARTGMSVLELVDDILKNEIDWESA